MFNISMNMMNGLEIDLVNFLLHGWDLQITCTHWNNLLVVAICLKRSPPYANQLRNQNSYSDP